MPWQPPGTVVKRSSADAAVARAKAMEVRVIAMSTLRCNRRGCRGKLVRTGSVPNRQEPRRLE
eukprot:CAMPEP_0204609944 /NCGR_PEP_ID=MMETSP0661-20131031/61225_1 /ASSEMBLY_ACC=CAM_ASM_000606 /TAXON_ID=109239 /ORGANISM="Alexandrium margalefi, Strain AMGDE01CS-322" /LENGTH=62 /DNA_ID=CAMNT_0051621703 /DNA_START=21 /DNA_END=206 /DNA_ORIENTATION=-